MIKVGQFVQFLESVKAQGSQPSLAFLNHLKAFSEADQELTGQHFNRFFADALYFAHWQDSKHDLDKQIKMVTDKFVSMYKEPADLDSVVWPSQMQVVRIDHDLDLVAILERKLDEKFKTEKPLQKKVLLMEPNRYLGIVRDPDTQELHLTVCDKICTIRQGRIEPLLSHHGLTYTAQLQFAPARAQLFSPSSHVFLDFKLREDGLISHGQLVRGFTFQIFQTFENVQIEQFQSLFFAIKRVESFFVNRQTDQFYTQSVEDLERCTRLIRMGDQKAVQMAASLVLRSEMILEQVYCEDRVLSLLIRDLRRTMDELGFPIAKGREHSWEQRFESTSS